MRWNIYTSILPLSVGCVLVGFDTVAKKSSKVSKIRAVYCWVVTASVVMATPVFWVQKLLSMRYTFLSAAYLMADIVRIVMQTLYRVQFLGRRGSATHFVLKNINCADQGLDGVGAAVPHKRNLIVCSVYLVLASSVFTVNTYIFLNPKNEPGKKYSVSGDAFYSANVFLKLFASYSWVIMLTRFNFLLYTIKQRITLLRDVIDKEDNFGGGDDMRRIAWRSPGRVTVTIVGNLYAADAMTDRQNYFTKLNQIYTCLHDAYLDMSRFYKPFFCMQLVVFIVIVAFSLSMHFMVSLSPEFISYAVLLTSLECTSLLLSFFVKFGFASLETAMSIGRSRYLTAGDDPGIETYLWPHHEHTFDCGYFQIDISLLYIVYDFVSLCYFAMVDSLQ